MRDRLLKWLPVIIVLATAASYYPVRSVMILQRSWYIAVQTPVTLNFILFFFFYGLICDRMTRKMSRKKGWIIWAVGLAVLIVFFKWVGGYPTIFG